MYTALAVLCLVGLSVANPLKVGSRDLDSLWSEFKETHQKTYADTEESLRRLVWEQNVHIINKHNREADMGHHTYWLGLNEFADLTNQEFKKMMGVSPMMQRTTDQSTFLPPSHVTYPSEVDWRKEGYVTPVKNQGQCGSCWAFSATGSLEGQHFKKTGKLVSLSEQNLVDCSKHFGNQGCNGGLMDNAYRYIRDNGGIDTEESYPYKARDGKCSFKKEDVGATDTGYVDIASKDEDALQKAVATVGPIAVAIDAGHISFQLYKHGVYVERKCSETNLDHGVLAVGYGTEDGKDYWLVKNSWGTSWGTEGYIKMARNNKNMCGIATSASYPTV